MTERRIFAAGRWRETGAVLEVRAPADGSIVSRVHRAGPSDVEDAIAAAAAAFPEARRTPSWRRAEILLRIAEAVRRRRDDLVRALALEAGKPVKHGRAEVDRAAFTFTVAAEEARRIGGELLPLDWAPWGEGRIGLVRRFPIGPIAAITPFNFPLNLAAHKIAPCVAAGNTMVLKPASQAPTPALVLAEAAEEAGLPPGALSVLPADAAVAAPLVADERLKMLTFTGSSAVGWELKARAGRKKVALELGGNAAAIVHADADLERAAERVASGGYAYAGQSCISVQRVLVHRSVHGRFVERLVAKVAALKVGDPLDEGTDVGPMISEQEAERAASWIREAVAGGARLALGGGRRGAFLDPAILLDVEPGMKVCRREAFAPLVAVTPYDEFEQALAMANDSAYGLQAGLFTRDAPSIWRAFEVLEVGGVMVDDVSTFRMDHMPYGGVKESGTGREGLRWAIEEMTELKILGWHVGRPAG